MVADRITNLTNDQGKIETFQGFFSAHYVQDPITKDIYNHGLKLWEKPAIVCGHCFADMYAASDIPACRVM